MRSSQLLNVIAFVIFLTIAIDGLAQVQPPSSSTVTCDCEQSSCGVCEVETGVTFYSAKCGAGNTRVKSCKKPTCVAVENQKSCLALFNKSPEQTPSEREPASQGGRSKPDLNEQEVAGEIGQVIGAASLLRGFNGVVEIPRENLVVYVGDSIETKLNGKVKVLLKDSSEMVVAANSRVRIEGIKVDLAAGRRKVKLELLNGKVRNRVQKKFANENTFEVRTKTAVAGVRGTDFVASFERGEREWVSEVRTFEGLVHLQGASRAGEGAPSAKSVDIPAGTYASLAIGPPARVDDDDEFFRSIENGSLSPVFKMKEDEIQSLKEATEFAKNDSVSAKPTATRDVSSEALDGHEICQAPSGRFNQCSFTCEGNPSGEKACRVELPGVSCVRRLCRASGAWTEPRRMPASQADQCVPGRSIVKDCGHYW